MYNVGLQVGWLALLIDHLEERPSVTPWIQWEKFVYFCEPFPAESPYGRDCSFPQRAVPNPPTESWKLHLTLTPLRGTVQYRWPT